MLKHRRSMEKATVGEAEVTAVGNCMTWCLLPAQAVVPVRDVVAFLRPDHPEDHGNSLLEEGSPRCAPLL